MEISVNNFFFDRKLINGVGFLSSAVFLQEKIFPHGVWVGGGKASDYKQKNTVCQVLDFFHPFLATSRRDY